MRPERDKGTPANGRPTGTGSVVLVLMEAYSSYHHVFIDRLRQRLSEHGLGVLCVTGCRMRADTDDYGCTGIYRLASNMDVAGVIAVSTLLGPCLSAKAADRFLARYQHLPLVTMGIASRLCSSVLPDNTLAMRELVEHMTRDVNSKNIVYLRGVEDDPDCRDREQAFREVMAERDIVVDESLMLRGNYLVSEGFGQVEKLLRVRKDIHVVVAANDAMARGAILALERQGLRVPQDVLVSGFDDSVYATSGKTSISTVRLALEDQINRAADLLLQQIDSKVPLDAVSLCVPSEVILRASSMASEQATNVAIPAVAHPAGASDTTGADIDASSVVESRSIAQQMEYLACHEIVELAHVRFARCSEPAAVTKVFAQTMDALSIQRAFVVRYLRNSQTGYEAFELLYAWPETHHSAEPVQYPVSQLLPDALVEEFQKGTLVATGVHVDDALEGVLLYDPDGPGRLSLDGVAQSLFGALHHCQQRVELQAQARRLERANTELVRMANFDSLTGLANRVRLHTDLEKRLTDPNATIAMLYFDLDGFKMVNDTLGHNAGDKLLTIVASRVKACVRSTDVVSRLGGDEFAVLLGNIENAAQAQAIADQLLAEIARPMKLSRQQKITLSASIGIARFPGDGKDAETLLKHADTAMYQAKAEGKNRVVWFSSELNRRVREQLQLDQSMREGLECGQFRLVFQPRMDLRSSTLVGVESLLRWTNSEGEVIPPASFIPVAEQTGFIQKLDAFALDTACAQASTWASQGLQCRVSVNISVARLQQTNVVEEVRATLARHDVPRGVIEFEVTESVAMTELRRNVDKLEALHELGIRLSIDDFGTAYSSLSYLKHLPVDCLKIDRSFLAAIECTEDELSPDGRIIRAVVSLGASLGLNVVAEGVENEAQHRFLRKLGCDEAQGYLFARPLEVDEIETVLGQCLQEGALLARATGT